MQSVGKVILTTEQSAESPEGLSELLSPVQPHCSVPLISLEEVEQHLEETANKTLTLTPVGPLIPPPNAVAVVQVL